MPLLGLLACCLAASPPAAPLAAPAPSLAAQAPALELPSQPLPAVAEAAVQPEVRGSHEGDVVRLPVAGASAALPLAAAAPWTGPRATTLPRTGGQLPAYFRSLPPPL